MAYLANSIYRRAGRIQTQASRTSERMQTTLILGGMMLFSGLLSFFFFAGQSLRLDEAQSLWQTSRSVLDIFTVVSQDVHVPLYHLVLHLWRTLLGDSVITARLLSLAFYMASIPALYALGKLAYNRNVGLFSAMLLSLSPFMNWYGNEIRMYTLLTLIVILNQYFFLKIWKARAPGAWWGYGITIIFGVYTHYFFFLNLAAQAAFYLFRSDVFPRKSFSKLLGMALVATIAIAPWIGFVLYQGQLQNQEPVLMTPTSINIFNAFSQFIIGFQTDNLNTIFLSLWPITVLLGFIALRRNQRLGPESVFFLTTILMSMALAFIVSVTITPLFVSRYLIFTVPSLYLLMTSFLVGYAGNLGRWLRYGLIGIMAITLVIEIFNPVNPVKENYAQAAQFINANVSPQDVVVLSSPFTVYPVDYYYRGAAPLETLPVWDRYAYGAIPAFDAGSLEAQVNQVTADHQQVWLLLSYDQGYEKDIKEYFDTHYQRVLDKTFSDNLTLYVYKLRYDTPLSQVEKKLTLE
ncbi:MAG: rane protein-like protein [Candidatus Adlerbacteria bacterium]|nr:rane protein-like protein [Candidatus Adlerbacteria bacterium]